MKHDLVAFDSNDMQSFNPHFPRNGIETYVVKHNNEKSLWTFNPHFPRNGIETYDEFDSYIQGYIFQSSFSEERY